MSNVADNGKPVEDDGSHKEAEEGERHDVEEDVGHGDGDNDDENEPIIGDENQVDNVEEKTDSDKAALQHMEQLEAEKLKARYPAALKPGGHAFLQKRLNKGQKYFDSGDYNMAKAKGGSKRLIPPVVPQPQQQQQLQQQQQQQPPPTGEAIPTPDNLPARKTSLVQSKLAAGLT